MKNLYVTVVGSYYVTLEYVEIHYKIINEDNGYKKECDRADKIGEDEQLLKCAECHRRYEWGLDDKGRIEKYDD